MSLQDNLARDTLEVLRVKEAVTIGPGQSVADAIHAMQEAEEGCVVVTEHGKPIGVFTERDVLTEVLGNRIPLETPITKAMTAPPRVIRSDSRVAEVARTMHEGGFRHLPVVDDAGVITGVLSVKRIVEYVVEHFPATVFNLPPEPGQVSVAREGA